MELFKEKSTDEIINLINKVEKDGTIKVNKISFSVEKDNTLDDLKQKLINQLMRIDDYDKNEIELIKILFDSYNK